MEGADNAMNASSRAELHEIRELRWEFEQLLYHEAWLLDHGRLSEWLDLMADDIHYWAPVRLDRVRGKEDLLQPGLMAHFDDDHQGLVYRVKRIQTGATVSEEPPARSRHFVSNVQVTAAHEETAEVASNFLVFHSHIRSREYTLVGAREDKWRRSEGSWKLKERLIILDHTTMAGLSVLF
jgi:3-phenylpropionate/cinnamic acid dioxygenase small subunit